MRLLAFSYERQAYAHMNIDVVSSLESHRRQVIAAERLVRLRPHPPVQVYLATAVRSLGERLGHPWYGNTGNTAAARAQIDRAITIAEEWVPRLPVHEGMWYLGYCYSILAGIVWAQGDIDEAIALERRAITAFGDVQNDSPNSMEVRSELGMIHTRMANFLYQKGQHEHARSSVQKAIGILGPVFRRDLDNPNLRQYMTAAFNQGGHVWLDSEPRRALRWYGEAEGLAAHSNTPGAMELLAETRSGMARALAVIGESARADTKSREAVEIAECLAKLDSANARYRLSLMLAYRTRGDVLEEVKAAAAVDLYQKALAIVQQMAAADPASWLKREAVADLKQRLKRST